MQSERAKSQNAKAVNQANCGFWGDGARTALDDFDLICASCGSYALSGADFELALRLVRDFSAKLATPDALHLASAIKLKTSLVTFGARLAEAAAMRGARLVARE